MRQAREGFIKSINTDRIVQLASLYHNNDDCIIFKITHGAFNVCYCIKFTPAIGDQDRWVVRIPIPCRAHWVEEKLEVEVATMKSVTYPVSLSAADHHTSLGISRLTQLYQYQRFIHIL